MSGGATDRIRLTGLVKRILTMYGPLSTAAVAARAHISALEARSILARISNAGEAERLMQNGGFVWARRRVKAPATGAHTGAAVRTLYFAQPVDGGPIKVGIAEKPARRLRDIEAHSPQRLRLIATTPGNWFQEQELLKQFEACRLHGEWFKSDCKCLQAYLKSLEGEVVA